jgi:acyl transferase domain-containing protein
VLAPVAEVQAALQGEEFAYLTMINAPADCLVAGQADACRRVVEKIGLSRCVENANEIIAHHPAVKSWEAEWRAIHHRETQPVSGVRFYSNARGGAYVPDRETVADALTDQATAAWISGAWSKRPGRTACASSSSTGRAMCAAAGFAASWASASIWSWRWIGHRTGSISCWMRWRSLWLPASMWTITC